MAAKEENDYNLDDFDYDGDESMMDEEEIDTEYSPDYDVEDEEEYDSDQDYDDD